MTLKNLSPKEKAKELIKLYSDKIWDITMSIESLHLIAKQCALIAVDEIIESEPIGLDDKHEPTVNFLGMTKSRQYWEEVKKEIENL